MIVNHENFQIYFKNNLYMDIININFIPPADIKFFFCYSSEIK